MSENYKSKPYYIVLYLKAYQTKEEMKSEAAKLEKLTIAIESSQVSYIM